MIAGIDHVNVVVSDMGGMVRFYTIVLGMKLTKHDPEGNLLELCEYGGGESTG